MLVNKTNILSLKNGKDASQYNGNYVWGCFVTNLFPVKAINYSQWNMYIFVLHNLLLSRHMQSYHITYSTFLHMDQITFVLQKVKIWFYILLESTNSCKFSWVESRIMFNSTKTLYIINHIETRKYEKLQNVLWFREINKGIAWSNQVGSWKSFDIETR